MASGDKQEEGMNLVLGVNGKGLVIALNRAIAVRAAIEECLRGQQDVKAAGLEVYPLHPVWLAADTAVKQAHEAIARSHERLYGNGSRFQSPDTGQFPHDLGVVTGRLAISDEVQTQIDKAFDDAERELIEEKPAHIRRSLKGHNAQTNHQR